MERYGCAPRYNIAHGQIAPVGTEQMRWGLLAPWRGHGGKRGPMTYVVPEGAITSTPQLRKASRIRVPADGFYAWRKVGSKRVPYWIHAGRVSFAALSSIGDDHVASFAIVTAPSTLFTGTAPLVVDEAWQPIEVSWRADAVSTWVNDLAHDDERCITPLGNPAQGELF